MSIIIVDYPHMEITCYLYNLQVSEKTVEFNSNESFVSSKHTLHYTSNPKVNSKTIISCNPH